MVASSDYNSLCRLCREGRLYDVEQWIATGHPISPVRLEGGAGHRHGSPLQIALKAGNHSLVQLLCSSGYDIGNEPHSPLDIALRTRRLDLLELLLDAGADPAAVDLEALFGTYNRDLLERFYGFGVDFSAGHELATALAYSSRNKPLYGFVKRHQESDPRIAAELQLALNTSIREDLERATALCLWAGADPRRPSFDLDRVADWESYQEDDESEPFRGWTSLEMAAMCGNLELLQRLDPDPRTDSIDELHRCARDYQVIEYLFSIALPQDPGAWILRHLYWFSHRPYQWPSKAMILQIAFKAGMKWESSSPEEIASIRRNLLQAPEEEFTRVLQELVTGDRCAPEVLKELSRTAAFRKRLQAIGYLPQREKKRGPPGFERYKSPRVRHVVKKLGFTAQQVKGPPPEVIHIGVNIWQRSKVIDRQVLYDLVWSEPMLSLSKRWGMSGRGLAKACARAQRILGKGASREEREEAHAEILPGWKRTGSTCAS